MKTYYYVHTGHRIGLDRFRRAAAIIKSLNDIEITLLCSDFRIAQVASEYGVKNAVGIDVVRNIPQISHHGDQLIFDSDEANPIMLEDMKNYFSIFLHIKSDEIAIDDTYYEKSEKTIKLSYFFGDDDYDKDLEKNLDILDDLEVNLQLGFYYFLDYEDRLKERFPSHCEFEEYEDMIKKTDVLITSSPQAVLESLASDGKPVYLQRADYTRDYNELFEYLNVPIVESFDREKLTSILKTIDKQKYGKINKNSNKMSDFIRNSLRL